MATKQEYDIIIIGGGPAGLSAGLYAARARLKTLLLEKLAAGGSIVNAGLVENYPGFHEGITGVELTQMMEKQALKFGMEEKFAEVTSLEISGKKKLVRSSAGDFTAKAVIVASGSDWQKLDVSGEKEFTGKGVGYCAVCDAAFFADQRVAVVGGGNAAINEALHLTKYAAKVIIIHRRDELRATKILQERAFADPKIEFLWNTVVEAIEGDKTVQRLRLKNVQTGAKSTLEVAGIFVATGSKPSTGFLKGLVPLDEAGAVITNEKMETSVPGVLAAGDIRAGSIRQVIAAAGDGAVAAIYAERHITGH